MSDDQPPLPDELPSQAEPSGMQGDRFGPSVFMPLGHLACHPGFYIAATWGFFALAPSFRKLLYSPPVPWWRELLLSFWSFTRENPWIWGVLAVVSIAHVLIHYFTSRYSCSEDYLFIQSGIFGLRTPGGPLVLFNDPIAFTTVVDCNVRRGPLSFLTGTGTLLLRTTEQPRREIRVPWVPNVHEVQSQIIEKAGVRKARMLSSI